MGRPTSKGRTLEEKRLYQRLFYAEQSPEDRSRRLERQRMKRHGLTEVEFGSLWDAQQGLCAACQEPMERSGRGAESSAVDHDHKTLAVRALLHQGCNKALGHLRERPSRAEGVAKYLRALEAKVC